MACVCVVVHVLGSVGENPKLHGCNTHGFQAAFELHICSGFQGVSAEISTVDNCCGIVAMTLWGQ